MACMLPRNLKQAKFGLESILRDTLINRSHNNASGQNIAFSIIISSTIMTVSVFKPFSAWLTCHTHFHQHPAGLKPRICKDHHLAAAHIIFLFFF